MDKTDKMALPSLSEATSSRRMARMGPTARMEVGEVAVAVAVRWDVFRALEDSPTTGIVRAVGVAAAVKEASMVLPVLRARAEEGASPSSFGIMARMASSKTVGFLREGRGPLVWEELGDLAERAAWAASPAMIAFSMEGGPPAAKAGQVAAAETAAVAEMAAAAEMAPQASPPPSTNTPPPPATQPSPKTPTTP
jgi:hypothetical protein